MGPCGKKCVLELPCRAPLLAPCVFPGWNSYPRQSSPSRLPNHRTLREPGPTASRALFTRGQGTEVRLRNV